ncbi:bifunctional adenosylcobinamide kinase/adenosylcobinamide-phosphate guanylyltransferase [Halobacillus kuroshimensis]|uniref:Bifunctional adenosylcobinamide kinase/adenosylcobinamide-phosphate guanylyltransferase n=1 Tax=Halobacillus kuroshimensis TaxID=302481 RepID=A0ABS3DU42_9BACI|nr:bifunctional adenosylcobinamide kinase/adenosylcobinamide-phosphate guanylyltransferase [Halobacillus kuroshimensis]MBN8234836.1 bifunctional adenosylcobinamide kinase/adenosylcobinamide-phosphate guanylyltransferase [Halobacillus kuroshimensis]
MEFVTGGAYNGKGKWARDMWLNHYKEHTWMDMKSQEVHMPDTDQLVVENIEFMARETEEGWSWLKPLLLWESQAPQRRLLLIGTDITRGIVPLEKSDREWRDRTGFLYQRIMEEAAHAYVVWFGIAEQLK